VLATSVIGLAFLPDGLVLAVITLQLLLPHFLAVVLVQFVDARGILAVCMKIYSTVPCCVGTHVLSVFSTNFF
jgi:hypothetical protein